MAKLGSFGAAKKEAGSYVNPNREPDTFDYYGSTIRVADSIGMAPLMDFASAAASGLDSSEMEGLAAIRAMLKDCIVPEDWSAFWSLANTHKAQPEELLEICRVVYEAVSGRPTDRHSDSSSGASVSTPPSSTSSPSAVPSTQPGVIAAAI